MQTAGGARESGSGRPLAGFLIRLVLIWVVCAAALAVFPQIERGAIRATVASSALTLRALNCSPIVSGAQIHAAGVSIQIVPDCTPTLAFVLLGGAIAAYPLPRRRKLLALAASIPVLWTYNILRVVVLVFVLARCSRATFDLVHVYLWQSITIAVVAGLFILSISGADRDPAR